MLFRLISWLLIKNTFIWKFDVIHLDTSRVCVYNSILIAWPYQIWKHTEKIIWKRTESNMHETVRDKWVLVNEKIT